MKIKKLQNLKFKKNKKKIIIKNTLILLTINLKFF